jgi:membrane fusion protein, multidrug efflux system
MNPPSTQRDPEDRSTANREASIAQPGDQVSVQGKRLGVRMKALLAAAGVVAIGIVIYLVAIYPRVENDKELMAAAIAAGRKTVTVVVPTQTSSAPELMLPGNVEANEMTSIYSRVDGYLKRWYVDIGDHVQAGQILADVESPQVDADLRMAQAQLELAEANLRLAQTNSARSQQLFENHVNSQQELDTVLANEQVQKANRDNAAAALTSAKDVKAFEQIRAPFAGTITARYVDVGSLVTSGSGRTVQKLFDLAQSDPVRVFVNVPQADVSSVKSGTAATITVDEVPGQTFAGRITRDAGAFDLGSRTLLLEIDVPNPDGRLYSGMYAHARFALQNPAPVLLIPDNAILIDSKGVRVFVVDPSGKIQVKPVALGRDFGTKSEILSGISTTDKVVQNPTDDLHEGMVVGVQPPDNQTGG